MNVGDVLQVVNEIHDCDCWFVDEIMYYSKGWYIVTIVSNLESKQYYPFFSRNVLVPFKLLETKFLKTKYHIDPEHVIGDGIIGQGKYYYIKRENIWKWKRYYEWYCYIEGERGIPEDDTEGEVRDYDTYIEKLKKLFSQEILPGSEDYPVLSSDIKRYNLFYASIDEAKKEIFIDNKEKGICRDSLYIASLNVGQGDTSIIVFPNNSVYIIDFNIYKRCEKKFKDTYDKLKKCFGFDRVTGVIITHKHLDHIRGMENIILQDDLRIDKVYINEEYRHESKTIDNLYKAIKQKNIPIINISRGCSIEESNARIEVFNPTYDNCTLEKCPDINDSSIALKVIYGKTEAVFTGDAGYNELNLRYQETDNKKFLKVSHHGSITGTNDFLLKSINPEKAFISVGRSNKYHHPCEYVLDKLKDIADISYKSKDVLYITDGNGFSKIMNFSDRSPREICEINSKITLI